jgi:2-polyprenyl-6-methoxyphenol hydroxylase-like FAD-dependent oxidoreductase
MPMLISFQGAQMAVESSIILARLLADNNPSDELFQRYHDLRRGRTGATTSFRRRVGIMLYATMWEFIRNLLVRLVAGYFIRSGFMGHYAYDVGTAPLTP